MSRLGTAGAALPVQVLLPPAQRGQLRSSDLPWLLKGALRLPSVPQPGSAAGTNPQGCSAGSLKGWDVPSAGQGSSRAGLDGTPGIPNIFHLTEAALAANTLGKHTLMPSDFQ